MLAKPTRLIVQAQQTVLPDVTGPCPATITIDLKTGKIIDVKTGCPETEPDEGVEIISVGSDHFLLPGLIDSHVHLNQPGRTQWEGFQTGTQAAISGGVTTLVDMPLNSIPPSTTVENLRIKREEALNVGVNCDVAFWGGIIPGNSGELRGLLKEGVKGFKCFLIESGVEEFPCVNESHLLEACTALDGTDALILFHAELDVGANDAQLDHKHTNGHNHAPDAKQYTSFLESRPPSLELDALTLILSLCGKFPSLRFHIVHLSAASALPIIKSARQNGISNLTVETCFHYLTLSSEEVPDCRTEYKCCPPIRDEANRQVLIQGVKDGLIDYVVSDHSPCTPELKKGDFFSAWGGVSGLGLGLSLLWTELSELGLCRIAELMGKSQAEKVRIDGKGQFKVGNDADFVIFDPEARVTVTTDTLQFKNKVSPYMDKHLRGVVKQTFLGGQLVWSEGKVVGGSKGQLLI